MDWWNSKAGKLFRSIMAKASDCYSFIDLTADIYKRTQVNPKVINSWANGGNPSVSTLNKIMDGYKLKLSLTDRTNVIELTQEFKNKDKEPDAAYNQSRINEIYSELKKFPEKINSVYDVLFPESSIVQLTARIEDFDGSAKKYIIRVRRNGEFIIRERTSIYEQALHVLSMQSFKDALIKKIGTSNYIIDFSWEDSIKKVKSC